MNLLFLKTKTKKYCGFLIILLFYNAVSANDSIPDKTFKEYCKTADAYMLYSYTDITIARSFGSYKRQTAVQSKLVINNSSGVDKYAFLDLNKLIRDNLKLIRVKTLKADGTVVALDSSLVFKHQQDAGQPEQKKYPIPGVEPGDTIDFFYIYTEYLDEYELKDFVNLYSEVPSLNSEFTVSAPPDLIVRYKTYNGFPEPQVLSNDTLIFCLFKMERMHGQSKNQYTCLPCELPYVYYSAEEKKSETRTWKDVYNQEFNIITQPFLVDYENSSYYRRWKKEVIGDAGDSSKFYKLNLLLNDIISNMKIEALKENELIKSSGYFLKEKRFDPISIRRMYRQLLEDLEIKYWAVFARSKRLGSIDPYYIRKGEYDHIFFAFENNEGTLSLLYPHELSYKYQINEIPTSLYNTEAVIARPFLSEKIKRSEKFINLDLKMAEVDSVNIDIIKLPGMGAGFNYLKQVFFCDVDVKNKNTTFKSNFSVSGGLSTDLRSFFSMLYQNKEMNDFYKALAEFEDDETALKIDTVTNTKLKNTKPFIYSITAQGTLKSSLTFINDSIVSITLNNLIQHSEIKSDTDSTNLNYYLDYGYSDIWMLIMKFPCDIELLGFDKYARNIKYDIGEYIINIKPENKNQLAIQSNYKIIKDLITKGEYKELKELNKLVEEIKNIRLLIKLKKSAATI